MRITIGAGPSRALAGFTGLESVKLLPPSPRDGMAVAGQCRSFRFPQFPLYEFGELTAFPDTKGA